jgi:hypothetical protein
MPHIVIWVSVMQNIKSIDVVARGSVVIGRARDAKRFPKTHVDLETSRDLNPTEPCGAVGGDTSLSAS